MVSKFVLKLDTNVDQQFFKRYLALTESQRQVVQDVVAEFKSTGVVSFTRNHMPRLSARWASNGLQISPTAHEFKAHQPSS
jgi:hypothetical protein